MENYIFILACKVNVRLIVYCNLVTSELIRKNNFMSATEKKMTGNITTRMPYSGVLSPKQTNTYQTGNEFRNAIGEQKVAFAVVIPPLALAAIVAVTLAGCWVMVQNAAGSNKNGPFLTLDDLDKLSSSVSNLLQGKSDEDKFTPVARKVLANPEIRGKLDAATGGTVLRADVEKKGGAGNPTSSKPTQTTKKKGGGKKPDNKNKINKNIVTLKERATKLKEIIKKTSDRMRELRRTNLKSLRGKELQEYDTLSKEWNSARESLTKVELKLLELRGKLLAPTN